MTKHFRPKTVSIDKQGYSVKTLYANICEDYSFSRSSGTISCILNIRPFEESRLYKVRIYYKSGEQPSVWLINPLLEKYGEQEVHHIYKGKEDKEGHPKLCVYSPEDWTNECTLGNDFIPWIVSWLATYEYWLLTGKWNYAEYRSKNTNI